MRHGKYRFLAWSVLPGLALYAVFVISPYAQAFYLALTDWRGVSARQKFIGLDNFARLAGDSLFWTALRHNAVMLLVVPLATIGIALFLASMLNLAGRGGRAAIQGVRGAKFYKIVYFFPQLLAVSIVAVLWQFVYTPNSGLLNGALNAVGLGSLTRPWLAVPSLALPAVMTVMVWGSVGFYVVLFSAAMQSIPRDVLEAAAMDGANRFVTFRRITLPLLWDTVQVAYVYLGILAMDGFALVQILTVGLNGGGPDNATEVLGLTLWRNAFVYGRFGYASAMGVAMFFLTLALAALTLRFTRRERIEY
ncbi:sugar ABC transporter permease [Micromonospora sp. DR5-3]|uniref:carbohydrate ABC transporter permease n=1 Tax=unclassified Micromonospora TaxID=2617518 RepID=UPI0011D46311|nr:MULTISPECIES: sugar ABC transporter permease [unclassified Micromonospora]MCW3820073.1 sugar ABC transporter permease [Micromonospora sp. DR5-3]TYC19890.1 sugar ABC transporter permease [Micromonospora sp. MP36]